MNLAALYTTQLRVLWEWRGGPEGAAQAPADHADRVDGRLPGDGVAPAGHPRGPAPRRRDRRHRDGAAQRARSPRRAGHRRATLADPHRGRGDPDPDPRVPVRGQRGARRPHQRVPHGPGRLVRVRDHQHDHHRRPGHRQRRLVLRPADPEPAAQARRGEVRRAGPGDRPDRRPRPPDPRRPDARGLGQHDGRLGPERHAPARALGGHPPVDDVGEPGGHPARQQRRDPRVPLVRARPPAPDGVQQPGRRRRDRPPRVQRRGPAVEQRRQHLQPHDRRRDPLVPHDGGHQGPVAGHRRQQGVPRLLHEPERLPALVHAVPRRVHQGAHPGASDAALRDHPPDASRPEVRRHACREQRAAARRQRVADHRGDVPRDQRHLRGLHRLRRARPPLRPGAGRVVRGARRRRHRDRDAREGRRGTRLGRTSSSSSRTTARASARRSSSATARASARSCST